MKHTYPVTLIISVLMLIACYPVHSQEPAFYRIAGFAAAGDGTTGGAGGDTLVVTTGTALQNALNEKQDSPTPLVIIVEGLINEANSAGLDKIDIKDVEDVTVIGAGAGAEFHGIGLKIRRASNIILRNLKVHHVVMGEGDCIGIEGPADHIWVDHCELYNEYQGADKDYYDGLLDAKADCEYITYSWNYLHDSWKTALVGSSESDIFDRKLTMHHNYFLNCNSRLPLFRASTGHFFNNYFKDIASTAINSRINSCVLIENNYFENTLNPWVSAYSDVLGGGNPVGNILVNSPFVYTSDTHELPYCSPSIPYEYADVLHNAEDVPALVMNFAGVGKLDIGDTPVFTLTKKTEGSGSITADPEKAFYEEGEEVTLTAVPESGWEFDSWSGDVSGTDNPLTLTMNSNTSITALFTTDKITLAFSTSGPGAVSVDPDFPMYDPGATVTLTAIPHEGAYFFGWSGDLSGNENPLEFTVDRNTEVVAIFKYEASDAIEFQFEESYCSVTGSVQTEHAGYTGSGFIDFANETGSNLSIAIDATDELVCTVAVRYAHGKTDDRSMKVNVNGVTQVESLAFPYTGDFTTWDTVSFELPLAAGNNTIEWVALTLNGGPNFDKADILTAASQISRGTCGGGPEVINAPGSLTASVISESQVDLAWTDNSDNESGFVVERMQENGAFAQIADLGANSTSYSDDDLLSSTTYTYRVKAYGDEGESAWSNTASVTTDQATYTISRNIVNTLAVYPNPMNKGGSIQFATEEAGNATLSLLSITGRRTVLFSGYLPAGTTLTRDLSTDNFAEGIYLVELVSGNCRLVTRLVLLK